MYSLFFSFIIIFVVRVVTAVLTFVINYFQESKVLRIAGDWNGALFLAYAASYGITTKLISAVWDNCELCSQHLEALNSSDTYTLRCIAGRDASMKWGG